MAERAVAQAEGVSVLFQKTVTDAFIMARNAKMERDLVLTGECNAREYPDTAEGRRWKRVVEALDLIADDIAAVAVDLNTLKQAAAFNPKPPRKPSKPKEE